MQAYAETIAYTLFCCNQCLGGGAVGAGESRKYSIYLYTLI